MDPTDLRAGLAEKLAANEPIDAQTFNAACFMLSRALDDLDLTVPEAAPLVRRLLRVAGRVVIDTGLAGLVRRHVAEHRGDGAAVDRRGASRARLPGAPDRPTAGRVELKRPEADWG